MLAQHALKVDLKSEKWWFKSWRNCWTRGRKPDGQLNEETNQWFSRFGLNLLLSKEITHGQFIDWLFPRVRIFSVTIEVDIWASKFSFSVRSTYCVTTTRVKKRSPIEPIVTRTVILWRTLLASSEEDDSQVETNSCRTECWVDWMEGSESWESSSGSASFRAENNRLWEETLQR